MSLNKQIVPTREHDKVTVRHSSDEQLALHLVKVLVRSLEIERTVATFLETEACVIC